MRTLILVALGCVACGGDFSTALRADDVDSGHATGGDPPAETGGAPEVPPDARAAGGTPQAGGAAGRLGSGGEPTETGGAGGSGAAGAPETGGAGTGGSALPIDGGVGGSSTGGVPPGSGGSGGSAGTSTGGAQQNTGGYVPDPCVHNVCCSGVLCDVSACPSPATVGVCCVESTDKCGCLRQTAPTSFRCE